MRKAHNESNVLTVLELSEYLRCHPSTVYRLLRRKAIPAFKLGSDWRFNRESIDVWRLNQNYEVLEESRNGGGVDDGGGAERESEKG